MGKNEGSKDAVAIFWHRRDLRIEDNAGLYEALTQSSYPVLPLFIFDRQILDKLVDEDDSRVSFIHDAIKTLAAAYQSHGSSLLVKHGQPLEVWERLLEQYDVKEVFTNHDFEPYAIKRDASVKALLEERGRRFQSFKDHVIFEKNEVLKADGTPYTVFTPYKRRWLEKLRSREDAKYVSFYLKPYPTEQHVDGLLSMSQGTIPTLAELGFTRTSLSFPSTSVAQRVIKEYDQKRDFPALTGTSRLGVHFRFGTISIRAKALKAFHLNQTFLSELIWRDFYAQILAHFPHVVEGAFRPKYDHIQWRSDEADFEAWCNGQTGYPLVDAGMRELNATGYMHNRVRMVVASFLTKHLLLPWQWGEQYFARLLMDFDLASNNGGWQWAAGCGTDAAPYFRIFNPTSQMKKFDPKAEYVRKWVPEYLESDYPRPIVDHKFARERCLERYKVGLDRA
ncbi:MAG: DNA photolyase family protein [Saprospiraceae bacterium]|nr:DNA photolyase family protein [Saprospiraceae bacterium]